MTPKVSLIVSGVGLKLPVLLCVEAHFRIFSDTSALYEQLSRGSSAPLDEGGSLVVWFAPLAGSGVTAADRLALRLDTRPSFPAMGRALPRSQLRTRNF